MARKAASRFCHPAVRRRPWNGRSKRSLAANSLLPRRGPFLNAAEPISPGRPTRCRVTGAWRLFRPSGRVGRRTIRPRAILPLLAPPRFRPESSIPPSGLPSRSRRRAGASYWDDGSLDGWPMLTKPWGASQARTPCSPPRRASGSPAWCGRPARRRWARPSTGHRTTRLSTRRTSTRSPATPRSSRGENCSDRPSVGRPRSLQVDPRFLAVDPAKVLDARIGYGRLRETCRSAWCPPCQSGYEVRWRVTSLTGGGDG